MFIKTLRSFYFESAIPQVFHYYSHPTNFICTISQKKKSFRPNNAQLCLPSPPPKKKKKSVSHDRLHDCIFRCLMPIIIIYAPYTYMVMCFLLLPCIKPQWVVCCWGHLASLLLSLDKSNACSLINYSILKFGVKPVTIGLK